jgi:hypothetical protein
MVKLEFQVHRANETTVSHLVDLGGEEVSAVVPAFEVELVSTNGGGAYTHRWVGAGVAEAKKAFVAGETISLEV